YNPSSVATVLLSSTAGHNHSD
ncbi:hypothetical protein A2U01_0112785, partial [Trifolium medium]|nr:hypothetical protein [Trifolium medium]